MIRAVIILSILLFSNNVSAEALAVAEHVDSNCELSIKSVTRKNGIVTIKGKVARTKEKKYGFCSSYPSSSYLLDSEKGVKYFPVTDAKSEKALVAPKKIQVVSSDGIAKFWIKFTAPPKEVTEVEFMMDAFGPSDVITITDK